MRSLYSQVVDLGDLVVEGLVQVPVGGDVFLDLLDSLDSLHVTSDRLVLLVELVVSQELDEIAHLEHVEI